MAHAPNTGSSAAVFTEGYIGGEVFLQKREIYKALFNRYREPEGLADVLINLGYKDVADNSTFHHFELDYLINLVVVESMAAGSGAGVAAVITIEEDSHQESGTLSPFTVGTLVIMGGMRGRISVTNKTVDDAHVYTVVPVDNTEDWSVDASPIPAIGVPMTTYGNAHADGTLQPDSHSRKPLRFTNDTQIIKEQYEVHGSVSTSKSEVTIQGKPYYYIQGIQDSFDRQMLSIENTLIFGKRSVGLTDTTAPDGTGNVLTTQGLEEYVEADGNTQDYGTFDYADNEVMVRTWDRERSDKQMCALMGTNLHLDHENSLHTRTQNTAIDFSMFARNTSDPKGKSANFGFANYKISGYTIHAKKWDSLNYFPVSGQAGSGYPEMGFVFPMAWFKTAKDNKNMHTISIMYKQNDRGSRYMKDWTRDITITNKDAFEYNHMSELGLRLARVNSYIKLFT